MREGGKEGSPITQRSRYAGLQGEAGQQHRSVAHRFVYHQRPITHSPAHRSQYSVSRLSTPDSDISPALPAPAAPSRRAPTSPSHRTCRLQAVRAWERVEGGTVSTYREWGYLIVCQPAKLDPARPASYGAACGHQAPCLCSQGASPWLLQVHTRILSSQIMTRAIIKLHSQEPKSRLFESLKVLVMTPNQMSLKLSLTET